MAVFPRVTEETLERYNVAGPRYTSYPTVPVWTEEFGAQEYAAKLEEAGEFPDRPLSLYVHVPFCREMCTYCGCNVVIAKDPTRADPYLGWLFAEMDLALSRLKDRRRFAQLHLGGGTPTFLGLDQLERLCRGIFDRFTPSVDAEIAIEIDPVVTSKEQLALLASYGFNRLSLGVQDLDSKVQEAVNRVQTADQTRAIVNDARELGYRGINMDLIYGLPKQNSDGWRRTLETVLSMRPDRLAVYSFAFLPESLAHQRRLDPSWVPQGREKLDLFGLAYETFVSGDYRPIGMDHFARVGDELERAQAQRTLGRNFQGYTVKAAADAVAFGSTGISDLQGAYAQNVRPLSQYAEAVESGRFATHRGILLSNDDRRRREVISQLMCNFWVDLGHDGQTYFAEELEELSRLEREGLLKLEGSQVDLLPLGRVFVRNVAMIFDTYLKGDGAVKFSKTV